MCGLLSLKQNSLEMPLSTIPRSEEWTSALQALRPCYPGLKERALTGPLLLEWYNCTKSEVDEMLKRANRPCSLIVDGWTDNTGMSHRCFNATTSSYASRLLLFQETGTRLRVSSTARCLSFTRLSSKTARSKTHDTSLIVGKSRSILSKRGSVHGGALLFFP